MKTVVATCSPYGDFEKLLTILQHSGLGLESDIFVQWHDNFFGSSDKVYSPEIDHKSLQEIEVDEIFAAMTSKESNVPLLLADYRCLWLLDFWAKKLPDAKFLLFYTRAESALVSACLPGIEQPQEVLENWLTLSRRLLNFQRCNRRRALLLDADAAIRQPQALIDICRLIGLTLVEYSPQSDAPDPGQAILERYLAHHLIANQPEIQSLQTELEASAQPLGNLPLLEIEPLEVFNKHSQRLAQQRKLQEERDEITRKLQVAELALEAQNVQQLRLKKESDQLAKTLDAERNLNAEQMTRVENVQHSNQTLENANKKVVQENEMLSLKFHQAQEEFEETFLEKQQLEQQAKKDQITQQQLQAQVDQLSQARDEQVKLNSEQQANLKKCSRLIKHCSQLPRNCLRRMNIF